MSSSVPPPPGGYGQPAYGGGQMPRDHPQGTTILVMGILGLVVCTPLGIAAWVMGNKALKEIDGSGVQYTNRGQVNAGRICGIIATALLVVSVIVIFAVVVLGVAASNA